MTEYMIIENALVMSLYGKARRIFSDDTIVDATQKLEQMFHNNGYQAHFVRYHSKPNKRKINQ